VLRIINIALGSSEKLCKALQCFLGGYIPYQDQMMLQSLEVVYGYTVSTGKKKPSMKRARGELWKAKPKLLL
jgi:hypothetical protein|tara:strand:- start:466 stop:681 length:216 start_codon:yes stop_codon:yes gene_type:complete